MKVMVAIPAYTGTIHLATMRSLMTDLMALQARGDDWTVFDECGNALIADARAVIVANFLSSDCDKLVFVDSDVSWEAGALLKLVDAPVDFVAGMYPQRKDPITYCVKYCDNKELWADPKTGLLEVMGVPAGFMCLSRNMLASMVDQYPDSEFYVETRPDKRAWALFADYRIGKHKMGEDYAFCRRWTDMGGKIWVSPEIKMGHTGNKTFIGNYGDWLRGR